ncbi:MAG: hypothetical protein AAF959_19130 [Cyanobacteria bacterium P01_D01_bin.56]
MSDRKKNKLQHQRLHSNGFSLSIRGQGLFEVLLITSLLGNLNSPVRDMGEITLPEMPEITHDLGQE